MLYAKNRKISKNHSGTEDTEQFSVIVTQVSIEKKIKENISNDD